MNKINDFMRTELQQHPGCFFHTHRLWAAKLQIIFILVLQMPKISCIYRLK